MHSGMTHRRAHALRHDALLALLIRLVLLVLLVLLALLGLPALLVQLILLVRPVTIRLIRSATERALPAVAGSRQQQ